MHSRLQSVILLLLAALQPCIAGPAVRILCPDGARLRESTVRCVYRENGSTTVQSHYTDSQGLLRYPPKLEPGSSLFCFVPGVGYGRVAVPAAAGVQAVTVKLRSGTTVTGRSYVAETGTPLGGVVIMPGRTSGKDEWPEWNVLMGPVEEYGYLASEPVISEDGTGRYTMGPLPPGHYEFVVSTSRPGGLGFGEVERFENTFQSEKPGLWTRDIKLNKDSRYQSISGHVVNIERGGTQVVNTEIVVKIALDTRAKSSAVSQLVPRRVKTDAIGNFRLYPVLPGKYFLIANGPGGFSSDYVEVKNRPVTNLKFGLHLE